ncbi:alpha beta-hydrolase [Raphidocelis subcapitata]|uniref:Alpha beta-hydrolase n=1 Tax=Raphidocelis subcapitata TaxID=307507 RepID=A0A2V0PN84_9CHLO|nr:alpha beta-hydrolase [Raphidocelis subcapitata]|eukprot:GBF99533.1 alpha beta-hydrolase [Raphidocelis subcapitata]
MRRSSLLAGVGLALVLIGCASARELGDNAYWSSHGLGVVQSGLQAGKVIRFLGSGNASMEAYVSEPPGAKPGAAVVLFSDIYGFGLNNTRLWADRLAKAGGFLVVLPDFFRGDALTEATRNTSDAWKLRHPKERVLKDFAALVPEIKKKWPSVERIGQQGFCWGGLYSVLLSGPQEPKVDAAVGFHASGLTPEAVAAVTGPLSLQAADPLLDLKAMNGSFYDSTAKVFAAKRAEGIPAEIKSHPDMPHGFALRGNASHAEAAAAAFDAGVAFLKRHI